MTADTGSEDRLLTSAEVAALFRVDPKTATRWAADGKLTTIRTPGGQLRFREAEVQAILAGTAAAGVETRSDGKD